MAKTAVIKLPDGDRTPFLRGIMVQSLMNSGLPFNEAYSLSQIIRDDLQDISDISTSELRKRVSKLLLDNHGPELRANYENRPTAEADIIVHTPTRSEPFSVGILAHSLESCTVEPEIALEGARQVYTRLLTTGHREIDHKITRRLIYPRLREP